MELSQNTLPKIFIKDLHVSCVIGVYHTERQEKQPIFVSVVLYCSPNILLGSDDIAQTVDYEKLATAIQNIGEKNSFSLIESLGKEILKLCLGEQLVIKAEVTIEKPQALIRAKSAGIIIVGEK